MSRRYVAFDIETAKVTGGPVKDVKALRPLGICCAATLAAVEGERDAEFWYGRTEDGAPGPRMTPAESGALVDALLKLVEGGATLLTWNGLRFDFDILAEESGRWVDCRRLALGHVDMMFHVFCDRGFPVALDRAAQGMNVPGKSAGVEQYQVPQMWAEGRTDEVLAYLKDDVCATLAVGLACEKQRRLRWKTQRGTMSEMRLPSGWLTVQEAMKLPMPDTSWMDRPMSRASFAKWLT